MSSVSIVKSIDEYQVCVDNNDNIEIDKDVSTRKPSIAKSIDEYEVCVDNNNIIIFIEVFKWKKKSTRMKEKSAWMISFPIIIRWLAFTVKLQ